jgi:hypothetical protein
MLFSSLFLYCTSMKISGYILRKNLIECECQLIEGVGQMPLWRKANQVRS